MHAYYASAPLAYRPLTYYAIRRDSKVNLHRRQPFPPRSNDRLPRLLGQSDSVLVPRTILHSLGHHSSGNPCEQTRVGPGGLSCDTDPRVERQSYASSCLQHSRRTFWQRRQHACTHVSTHFLSIVHRGIVHVFPATPRHGTTTVGPTSPHPRRLGGFARPAPKSEPTCGPFAGLFIQVRPK